MSVSEKDGAERKKGSYMLMTEVVKLSCGTSEALRSLRTIAHLQMRPHGYLKTFLCNTELYYLFQHTDL